MQDYHCSFCVAYKICKLKPLRFSNAVNKIANSVRVTFRYFVLSFMVVCNSLQNRTQLTAVHACTHAQLFYDKSNCKSFECLKGGGKKDSSNSIKSFQWEQKVHSRVLNLNVQTSMAMYFFDAWPKMYFYLLKRKWSKVNIVTSYLLTRTYTNQKRCGETVVFSL